MAKYRVTAPDGNSYEINAPDDATQEQVMAYAQANYKTSERPSSKNSDLARLITGDRYTPDQREAQSRRRAMTPQQREAAAEQEARNYETAKGRTSSAGQVVNYLDALQHHGMGALHGLAQLGVHGLGAVGIVSPETVAQDDAALAQRERDYQQRTAGGNFGTYMGAAIGEVAPWLVGVGELRASGYLPKLAPLAKNATAGQKAVRLATRTGQLIGEGALMGAAQPVTEGNFAQQKAGQIKLGAATAPLAAVGAKGVSKVASGVRAALRSPEERAAREAVRLIQREAGDSVDLMTPNPSQVPGATRTLFEETQVPGIARLETQSRGAAGTNWVPRDIVQNEARLKALRGFAGDEADIAAAEQERSAATRGLREAAFSEGEQAATAAALSGFSTEANKQSLKASLEGMAAEQGGRDTVQKAIRDVIGSVDSAPPTVQGLYRVRQSINDLIEGKAGSEKSYAKAATAELIQARNLVDQELVNLAPSFDKYLASFREMSKPINRMQAGQELIRRGTGSVEDLAGNYELLPGKYGQQVKNLDELVKSATGFEKGTAEGTFLPEDLKTIKAIQEDLSRQAQRIKYGSGGGSHTASQLGVGERLNNATWNLIENVPFGKALAGGRQYLKDKNAENLSKALERVLKNPNEYRAIAGLMKPNDAKVLEQALIRIGVIAANESQEGQ